jgi:glycosyltransferase involved in cell wall biosynthesis
MNIWILNHYAITPDMPGGTRHIDLAQELVKKGHQVTIIAAGFNHTRHVETKSYNRDGYAVEMCNDVRFVWLKTMPYVKNDARRMINMLDYAVKSRRLTAFLKDRPDVVVGSSVHLFAVYSAHILAKRVGVPLVMEVRDLWPQTLIDMGVSKYHPAVVLFGVLEKYLYKRAAAIVALMPYAYRYIEKCGIERSKVRWIPNGVYVDRFNTAHPTEKNRSEFRIVYLGGFTKSDNLLELLQAAKQTAKNANIQYYLIGDGDYKTALLEFRDENNLTDTVHIEPPVRKTEVPLLLEQASAVYLPMQDLPIYEYGFSFNKLFDYMASGRPIIMYGNPRNNIIKEMNCGVSVLSRDELARTIADLAGMDEQQLNAMGKRGRDFAEKNHNIPDLACKLESLLLEVTGAGQDKAGAGAGSPY